jgi:hypothetical protein
MLCCAFLSNIKIGTSARSLAWLLSPSSFTKLKNIYVIEDIDLRLVNGNPKLLWMGNSFYNLGIVLPESVLVFMGQLKHTWRITNSVTFYYLLIIMD